MAAWKSRGLRGSVLEEKVNLTIETYRNNGLAMIQKIPTPITPVQLDGNGHITLAYFGQRSTVDYIGAVQGIPVCFDAKECREDTFPLANIHQHQMDFMQDFTKQGGISFFLICFSKRGEYYCMPYHEAAVFWNRMEEGGRKSFRYDELNQRHFIGEEKGGTIRILDGIQKCLNETEG